MTVFTLRTLLLAQVFIDGIAVDTELPTDLGFRDAHVDPFAQLLDLIRVSDLGLPLYTPRALASAILSRFRSRINARIEFGYGTEHRQHGYDLHKQLE